MWTWGEDTYGEAGNGVNNTTYTTPQEVCAVGGGSGCSTFLSGIYQVAAGSNTDFALSNAGNNFNVYTWGANFDGELGNGTTTASTAPVEVLIGAESTGGCATHFCNVLSLAAGGQWAGVVNADGTVYSWGDDSYGTLGDGGNSGQTTPVQVKGVGGSGTLTKITALGSGGSYHQIAITSTDGLVSWGSNVDGQLGNNSTISSNVPVSVPHVTSASAVAGGSYHSLAVGIISAGAMTKNDLLAVSCQSSSWCWAVGYYDPSGGAPDQTLIEQWNGATWTIVTSPNVGSGVNNGLYDISCPNTSWCVAVGKSATGTAGVDQTLALSWTSASNTWAVMATAQHTSVATANDLYGVSCLGTSLTSGSMCNAVGTYGSAPTLATGQLWNGSSWSIQNDPAQGPARLCTRDSAPSTGCPAHCQWQQRCAWRSATTLLSRLAPWVSSPQPGLSIRH